MKKKDVILGKTYSFNPQGDPGFIPIGVTRVNYEGFTTKVRVLSFYPHSDRGFIDFVVVLLDKNLRGHSSYHENLPEHLKGRLWNARADMLSPIEPDFDPKDKSYRELFI